MKALDSIGSPAGAQTLFANSVLAHLNTLAQLSPDGIAIKNDIGFSGATLGPGLRLIRLFPRWSAEDCESARWICTVHARQLGLDRDELDRQWEASGIEAELAALREIAAAAARAAAEEAAKADLPFGLSWSVWKITPTGKRVRSAALTGGPAEQAFRAAMREIKAGAANPAGFSWDKPWKGNGFAWGAAQWDNAGSLPAPVAIKPVECYSNPDPLANPAGLLSYQIPHAAALVAAILRTGAAVDTSDTGTGKTYAALAAFRQLGVAPLIVAPKAVLTAWQRAAAHMGVALRGVINYESLRTGKTEFGRWQGEGKNEIFVFAQDIAGLVFDEAHRCKGVDTQNAFLLRAARDQGIRTIAASATLGHSPLEMRAIGHLTGLSSWGGFWKWARANGCNDGRFGGLEFSGNRAILETINRQIFPRAGSRMRIADLGDLFPESQITAEAYNANGAAKEIDAVFAEMERELAALSERASADNSESRAAALVAMLRARQKAELIKVPLFAELISDAVENGQSVATFVCFRETQIAICERLAKAGITAGQIHGQQSGEDRQVAIDAFQADRSHAIVAMISAGGVGISLHDIRGERSRVAFISPTWSAVELRQALGRVHRAGGKSKSLQRIVYVAGSVEDRVRGIVAEKLSRLDTLNDGDLGKPAAF